MRLVLPDLRLLCLTEKELTLLPQFLTSHEKLSILEHIISCGSVGIIPENICKKGKRSMGSTIFQPVLASNVKVSELSTNPLFIDRFC